MYLCIECIDGNMQVLRFYDSIEFIDWIGDINFTDPVIFITPNGYYYNKTDIIEKYNNDDDI